MTLVSTAQFRKGMYLLFQDKPHMIVDITFVSPGRGCAFYRVKFKNLFTGRLVEYTYKSGEKVEEVLVETREAEYSYFDGLNYVFIEPRTFEQYSITAEVIGDDKVYLKPGALYRIKFYEDQSVGVVLPKSISSKVIKTENAIKGNTATNALKPALVESGLKILVPLFIKVGDEVMINTETGSYVSKC
ncbi:MAG TPA: elongation factor P [Candidatus Woesebacteria bacterium]|jgi:elongation factor P|nr:elongation factor P [Candidatus Woesebacteria bacterium]